MRGTTKITGEVILRGLPHREKLKRYLLPNIIENLHKYGFIVFRGLINIGAWMIYQRKNFLKTVGIFIAQNAGHPFMTAPQ